MPSRCRGCPSKVPEPPCLASLETLLEQYMQPSSDPVPQGGNMTLEELSQVLNRLPHLEEDWDWGETSTGDAAGGATTHRSSESATANYRSPPSAQSQYQQHAGAGANAEYAQGNQKEETDKK